jgi:hypothetical protein
MHNLTPLGMLMHLKDLDRQAVPKLRPLRSQRRDSAGANAVGIAVKRSRSCGGFMHLALRGGS